MHECRLAKKDTSSFEGQEKGSSRDTRLGK